MKLKTLKERRGAAFKQADEIITAATRERRDLTGDENSKVGQLKAEIFGLDREIAAEEAEIRAEIHRAELASGNSNRSLPLAGYSLCRAIHQAGSGRLDGLEAEVSQEIAKRTGKTPDGFYVPHSALVEARAMSVSGDSGNYGGGFVPTEHRGFIDALRPLLMVGRAGATILDGLTSNIAIPRQSAASTATWKTETATLDEVTPAIGQLELSPKRVGAFTVLSKQLLIQGSPDVEKLVRNDLLAACATALDAAAINGSGADGQPTGILNTASIGSVVGGTNGLAPTWAHIVALIAEIEDANAASGSLGFMTNPSVAAKLRATVKVGSTDSRMILEGNTLLDFPVHLTTQVPSNLTKGTSSGVCSAIIFGDFSGVFLASFGQGVDLVVDPFTNATAGQTRIIANSYVDVGIRRAAQFAAMKDALTA